MVDLETIVFDFNGTLADDLKLSIEIGKRVFEKHGYEIPSDEEIEALRNKPAKEVVKALLGRRKWVYRIAFGLKEGVPLYSKERNNIKPFDGIVNVVNDLSKDYEILILSSNNKETVKYVLDKWSLNYDGIYHSLRWFGLERLFGKDKVLQKILRERGLVNTPEKLIYIGDEARDIDACRKSNVNFLGVTWGYNNEIALINSGAHPEYLVSNPSEIPNKINLVDKALKAGEKLFTLTELPITPQEVVTGSSYANPSHSPNKPTTS